MLRRMAIKQTELTLDVSVKAGTVSAVLERPRGATALYVLAHGAGAGMTHPFMTDIAAALHERKIATLRYQFPYTERGGRRPDPKPRLLETVRAAIAAGAKAMRGAPVVAGGKSMGGRMTSHVAADEPPAALRGLVYLGFPLHAPGKDGIERAAHLTAIDVPSLFVQGTRDKLANLTLMEQVLAGLQPGASMVVVDGGDHSFNVPKRSGRTRDDVLTEVADTDSAFIGARIA